MVWSLMWWCVLKMLFDPESCSDSGQEQQLSSNANSADASSASSCSCSDSDTTDRSSANVDEEGEQDGPNELIALRQRLKRQAQTAKARAASLVTRTRKRLAKNAILKPPDHKAEQFRPYVQPDTNLNDAGQWTRKARSTRLRLLVSYLRAWASVLINIFSSVEKSKDLKVHHTINTIITDDTNMRLSTETPDVKEWKSSRIVSVMNCVQALIISFGPSGHEAPRDCKILPVHTPLVALPRADRDSLCSELISRLFLFMGQVSERFQAFKVAKDIAARVPISAIALCFDSLVTNLAVLKVIRGALFEQLKKDRADADTAHHTVHPIHPVWTVCCLIHQLALSRRHIVLGFSSYWSSVVRLGHLFEVHAFRQQFRRSLLFVVVSNAFHYIPAMSLPPESCTWREQRNRICGVLANNASRHNKKRLELHMTLMRWDNGCPEQPSIVHWCCGDCCPGADHRTKARWAMLQCCRLFALLFCSGYPVPLTYRWVHCHRALQYLLDACLHIWQI